MLSLPNITPADPMAPEDISYQPKPLKYGLLGRLLLARELHRERQALRDLSPRLLRDAGLTRHITETRRFGSVVDLPERWQDRTSPMRNFTQATTFAGGRPSAL